MFVSPLDRPENVLDIRFGYDPRGNVLSLFECFRQFKEKGERLAERNRIFDK